LVEKAEGGLNRNFPLIQEFDHCLIEVSLCNFNSAPESRGDWRETITKFLKLCNLRRIRIEEKKIMQMLWSNLAFKYKLG